MAPRAKLRDLNSDRSTIGWASVSSQANQATNDTAATRVSMTTAGEANQSASLPMSSITCSEPTQATSSPRPTLSTFSFRVGVSRLARLRQQRKAHSTPTGTLMKKIQGHEKLSEMKPPRRGPQTGATRVVMDQTARPVPRRSGGKIDSSRAWEPGIRGPEQPPCSTRKRINEVRFQDIPHRNEAAVKASTETTKVRTTP